MDVIRDLVEHIKVPAMAPVRQIFDDTHIADLEAHLSRAFTEANLAARIKPGETVALGVGSRGVAELPTLVRLTVEALKAAGAEPFIVPAMGSHGGASAEGQTKMLASLGVTEESAGCPIRSSMETVTVGQLPSGLAALMDAEAMGADHIAFINRVKPHTSFSGTIESGLCKMMAIGLANQKGADSCHQEGFGRMAHNVVEMAKVKLANAPILFGLATVENGYDRIAMAEVVFAEDILAREPALLAEARSKMPRVLFDPLDVLVVGQMGKDFSGSGMDPNITGRPGTPYLDLRQTTGKLVVLNISQRSGGNATGLGLADFCTKALYDQIDYRAFYTNHLTSTVTTGSKIPMIMATDKMAVQGAVKTCNAADPLAPRIAYIPNTLQLEHVFVSEALLAEARSRDDVEALTDATDWPFDAEGTSTLSFKH
ncbi:hypothetical protein RDV64_03125 [Acuticoccus sp. MNP-M23]|uniref:hypothetical protein n=1 Tax=Acuticoccus sp. MNP-M23 TaxID=3072793 RepID=UPI00281681A9|nr:hypothetical protein [Acuticoccus sp. MNP-M23]WMS43412.1 hypothetical protein RDV64_03125 [Acuticoccus sp. MNP-M23]